MQKVFLTIPEQIARLRGRGLEIPDERFAAQILEKENYYHLINGYKELFLDRSAPCERYREGTQFSEFVALYEFDRELRILFLRHILEVENDVKSVLSHKFAGRYGLSGYLKIESFDTGNPPGSSPDRLRETAELITKLQREISNQLSRNNPMISHNLLTYGCVPLWVLVNSLSFGIVSNFYSLLRERDKNEIGRTFSLRPDEMESYLPMLALFPVSYTHLDVYKRQTYILWVSCTRLRRWARARRQNLSMPKTGILSAPTTKNIRRSISTARGTGPPPRSCGSSTERAGRADGIYPERPCEHGQN